MVVDTQERMPRVIQTAEALRMVRRAQIDFLMNWTLEQANAPAGPRRLARLAPPPEDEKHDWNHLYDGSVLDD